MVNLLDVYYISQLWLNSFLKLFIGPHKKIRKTTLCVFRKKGNFFHESGEIAPEASPQLRH